MSFRKRNVGLSSISSADQNVSAADNAKVHLAGVRPSPFDGRLVTSTGTSTLDGLLAGHAGLPLGCSLLIEEQGTTDYAGALLKFYAAEGLLQGHHVHVVALPEQWGRELPGVSMEQTTKSEGIQASEKMKIAWRYENLGQFDASRSTGGSERLQPRSASDAGVPYSHTFDLTKRLTHPSQSRLTFYPLHPAPGARSTESSLASIIASLTSAISDSSTTTVHRLIVPSMLSPFMYPADAPSPNHILHFIHSLRSLCSSGRMTTMSTLPLSLHPRSSGLTRWIELLHDGVLELAPFPHSATSSDASTARGPSGTAEDCPQGLLRVHRLPILHESGGGLTSYEDDWTFSLSRRTLKIKSFNLPPLEGDQDAQQDAAKAMDKGAGRGKKTDMDF